MPNIYNMADTWNDGATVFTAIKMNVTDTASNASSLLMDLQVGGSSVFSIRKDSLATIGASSLAGSGTVINLVSSYGSCTVAVGGGGALNVQRTINVSNGNGFVASNDAGFFAIGTSADTYLRRDAANTLAQRNGANPQTFRIYNTYTDASNYERGFIRWASNVLEIGAEAAGTGSTRLTRIAGSEVRLQVGGANQYFFTPSSLTMANGVDIILSGYVEYNEVTAPAGSANTARLYAEDDGTGKTRLMVIFGTGAAQQIAIEP